MLCAYASFTAYGYALNTGGNMGGVWVTPQVKNLIINMWLHLKEKSGKEPSAKDVLAACKKYLASQGDRNTTLPKLRKTQEIISEARKSTGDLSRAESALDEAWTVSSMARVSLPSESIPSVIQVWRYAVMTGEPFTVRQAKWVSRLHHFISDTTLLWYWTRIYSRRELLAALSGEPINTNAPDLSIFFSEWEGGTLKATDYRQGEHFDIGFDLKVVRTDDGEIIEEFLHGITDIYSIDYSDENTLRDEELADLIEELPSLASIGMKPEARMVYLRWFNYLIKAPGWAELSAQEAYGLIKDLRYWVMSEQEHIIFKKPRATSHKPLLDGITFTDMEGVFPEIAGQPLRTLKAAGYKINMEDGQ
jgi:hypothetical protein